MRTLEQEINDLESNLRKVQKRIEQACKRSHRLPNEVTLVAVTKETNIAAIKRAFELGIRNFGENRVQEAIVKIENLIGLKPDITWHMIGHLQSNKAKQAVKFFDIIHSVDSIKLAKILDRETGKKLSVLLEVNVSGEETKGGFKPADLTLAMKEICKLPNLQVKGLMTIAPLVNNPEEVRPVFKKLRELGNSLGLEHLSMGMTDDFEVAIEEGATLVRIGRAIFGKRRI